MGSEKIQSGEKFRQGEIVRVVYDLAPGEEGSPAEWGDNPELQRGNLGEITLCPSSGKRVAVRSADQSEHRWWKPQHIRRAKLWEIKKFQRQKAAVAADQAQKQKA